jgi:hypothetical protein
MVMRQYLEKALERQLADAHTSIEGDDREDRPSRRVDFRSSAAALENLRRTGIPASDHR